LAKLALAAFSTLLALGVAEAALRIAGVSYPNFYRPDADRGWGLQPGAEGWWRNEGLAWVRINSTGQRDVEHAVAKPAGRLRIAVLGDSCAEALQVPVEQTFWKLLESQRPLTACPAAAGRVVETFDFGVAGYGTAQELLTLRRDVWRYQPDVVLLAFYPGNDVRNNARALEQDPMRPYFTLAAGDAPDPRRSGGSGGPAQSSGPGATGSSASPAGSSPAGSSPTGGAGGDGGADSRLQLDSSFRATTGYRLRRSLPGRLAYAAYDHLRLLQVAKEGKGVLDGWIGAAKARTKETGEALQELGLDNAVYSPPADADWRQAWQVTEAMIAAMRDEAAAHHARFGLLLLTTGMQVTPDAAARDRFQRQLGVADLFYPGRRLATFSRAAGIPVLDLAPPLQQLAARNHLYLHGFANTARGEGHWNARGHAAAAPLIADWLCRELIDTKATP
jgi:hypothetical protein